MERETEINLVSYCTPKTTRVVYQLLLYLSILKS